MNCREFSSPLVQWYHKNKREMPWRDELDPYKIWVSEIMLQQTRVEQARPFFDRFIVQFPTVKDLASAHRQDVLKAWEGLGYYSRARNLQDAAITVMENFGGKIPESYEEIIKLKGIGPYTAAAVTSIAFGAPNAVVDGNVLRVVTRFLGIENDTRSSATVKEVQDWMSKCIHNEDPSDFNQSVMELGAMVCTPTNPDCENCPLNSHCIAFKTLKTDSIPYKSPAKKKDHKNIGVGIIENDKNEVLISLRPENVMLGGLWEFPGGKQEEGESIENTVERELLEELGIKVKAIHEFMKINHTYSHFSITMHAFKCVLLDGIPQAKSSQQIKWVSKSDLELYPFPKANKILTEKLIQEN